MYPDDGLGEIFLKTSKQGSTLSGVMDAFAIAVSIGLQYGVPLESFVSKFINMKFEPSGMTNDPDIRFATSLVDYVFRRLALDHLPIAQREALGIRSIDERKETAAAEAAEKLGTTVEEVVAAVKAEKPSLPIVESSGVPEAHAATRRSATRAARRCCRPAPVTSAPPAARPAAARKRGGPGSAIRPPQRSARLARWPIGSPGSTTSSSRCRSARRRPAAASTATCSACPRCPSPASSHRAGDLVPLR